MPVLIDRSYRKPFAFLIVATPLAIESCITAATPPSHWLNPGIALFLIAVYGLPIVWLREFWLRHKLSALSLLLLGFIYGLLNEGILAHTLTQRSGEPLTHFLGYDELAGFHPGWAGMIIPWHALMSVWLMMSLTHLWWPQAAQPWLTNRSYRVIGGLCALMLPLYFVIVSPERPAPPYLFPLYLLAMVLLFWLALRLKTKPQAQVPPRKRLWAWWVLGLFLITGFTLASFVMAEHKANLGAFYATFVSAPLLLMFAFQRAHPRSLLAFALGGAVGMTGFSCLLSKDPLSWLFTPVFLVFVIFSLRRVLRQANALL